MQRNLVVLGGSGFLGRRICQAAVNSGKFTRVVSLSKSGRPPMPAERWTESVTWGSCDIFTPETYGSFLEDATDVVHSIGVLLEDQNYKSKLRSGTLNIYESALSILNSNIVKRPLRKQTSLFTYDLMNRYSAVLLATTFAKMVNTKLPRKPTFTYISADKGFPLIPSGYINSKRQAEAEIMQKAHILRPILFRPGFMFDETDSLKTPRSIIKNAMELLNYGNRIILNNKLHCVNQLLRPTVSTQQVSRAFLKYVENENHHGVVSLDQIMQT